MTNSNRRPIGVVKGTSTVYCTICTCSRRRKIEVLVYENTQTAKEEAIKEFKKKAAKEYTCRICKSIKRDVENV